MFLMLENKEKKQTENRFCLFIHLFLKKNNKKKTDKLLFYSLVHAVVLDVPVEGDLIADEDVDGVALNAVLLLFLLLRA